MKKENCYDIGVIQAFTDGELSSDLQENVIGHIALCDSCATLLAETEDESAFAFSALDEELNVLVPTERLRTKVFKSIKESKEKASWWNKLVGSFGFANGFSFNNPSLIAFASLFLFVSALGVGIYFYNPMPMGNEVAGIQNSKIEAIDVELTPSRSVDVKITDVSVPIEKVIEQPQSKPQNSNDVQVLNAGGIKKGNNNGFKTQNATYDPKPEGRKKPIVKTPNAPAPSPNLSGEDSYLQTITTLSRTVNANKDMSLRPTERVSFERDMAVVDDAIKKMKKEVRKNPKNKAAREILRSSYQNKIDLLNSVAERTELMASIE